MATCKVHLYFSIELTPEVEELFYNSTLSTTSYFGSCLGLLSPLLYLRSCSFMVQPFVSC